VLQAAGDTAMVLALAGLLGVTGTIQSSTTFLKPVTTFDLLVEARVVKASKSTVYGTVDFRRADKPDDLCAQTTTLFGRKVE
jgi:acyl-coenzyme A thioesterase PaaI-like protein